MVKRRGQANKLDKLIIEKGIIDQHKEVKELAKEFAIWLTIQALDEAAERAKVKIEKTNKAFNCKLPTGEMAFASVDKNSILSLKNEV
jgi:hypothetical protein